MAPRNIFTPPFSYLNLLDGKSKKDFEIVIARYDEDVSWSDNYKKFRTIYNKGDVLLGYEYITLENKGHLADTILRHIISNYDNLATVTFFCHGSFNYRNDQLIKDSGHCHRSWCDFISTNENHLMFIPRYDLPSASDTFYNYPETSGAIYRKLFGKEYRANFPWACGKWISVGKKYILKHPKEFYQNMLNWVLSPHNDQEPSQHIYRTRGIFIERFILHAFKSDI